MTRQIHLRLLIQVRFQINHDNDINLKWSLTVSRNVIHRYTSVDLRFPYQSDYLCILLAAFVEQI